MTIPSKIFRGYLTCAGIAVLGFAFLPMDSILPFSVARVIVRLAILGVGVTTFRWGALRGLPARDREGRVQVGNILSSLAMTGVMTLVVFLAVSPIFVIIGELSMK